ncbi:MAG: DNA internalization-related competence protein ComEC/Rec2 [Gemmatimonadetes bacterium RBG_16_66_8]|nr:MAG: DNA internalization-related competence protein ComEC/Rec2 [Gemmatimonadetes bacterium RBG_16_66_8]
MTAFAASDRSWSRRSARERGPLLLLDRWAETVAAVLDETLDGPPRQIVAALVIGERTGVSADVSRRYARTGLIHVLSISGLHVGLVAGGAYVVCRWLLARSEWLLLRANVPKLCAGFMAIPALAYAGMAGFSVPTVRSVVMVLLVGAGVLLDRQRDWLASLAGAALGISVLWPGSVFDISFQLSFASVLAIVLGMQRIGRWWAAWEERRLIRLRGRGWRLLRWAVGYCSVALCATVGTAPLAAWHFNVVSLVSLIANPLVVPLLGLVTVATGLLAALVLPLSPRLAAFLFAAVGGVVELADALVARLAALPGAAIHVVTPSLVEIALLFGLLVALFVVSSPVPRRVLVAVCMLGLAVDGLFWCVERWHRAELRLSFLSVGQGDSTVIEFPGAAVMVVDGGGLWGGFDIGERCIAPYLWRRKIAHVDVLVLTHPQLDHYGGLGFLARTFAPDALWWNGVPGSGQSFEAFRSVVESAGVPALAVRRGFRRVIGGVDVRVLSPGESGAASLNDSSVTLRLQYGSTTVLLPGDLEAEGERRLVTVEREWLRSAVLKIPHHGSRTSSTSPFLDAVAPSWAVISAGYENRFGLPHRQTLEAYRARGVHVWRTDVHGAVIVRVRKDGAVRIDSTREPNHAEPRR